MDTSKLLIEFIIGIFLLPKRINANFSHFLAINGMRKNAKFLAKKIRHFAGSPIPNVFFLLQNVTVFQSNCSHNHRLKNNGNTHSLNQNGNFPSMHNNYTAGNGQNGDSSFELSDNCTVTSDIAVKKCSAWRSSTRNRSFRKIWLFNT